MSSPQSYKRVALIFGNGEFSQLPPLQTAINDAEAMDQVLRRSPFRFKTVIRLNCSREDIISCIDDSKAYLQKASEIIFFCSGYEVTLGRYPSFSGGVANLTLNLSIESFYLLNLSKMESYTSFRSTLGIYPIAQSKENAMG